MLFTPTFPFTVGAHCPNHPIFFIFILLLIYLLKNRVAEVSQAQSMVFCAHRKDKKMENSCERPLVNLNPVLTGNFHMRSPSGISYSHFNSTGTVPMSQTFQWNEMSVLHY